MSISLSSTWVKHRAVRQFIKFCIIGLIGTVIDVGIFKLLMKYEGWSIYEARTLSFTVATINSYICNSLWTFKGLNSDARHKQFIKFLIISTTGLLLNLGIMTVVFLILSGHSPNQKNPNPLHTDIALATAVVLVAFWNFLANKFWTFKHHATELPDSQ